MLKRVMCFVGAFLMVFLMPLSVTAAAMGTTGLLKDEPAPPYEKLVYSRSKFAHYISDDRMNLSYTSSY